MERGRRQAPRSGFRARSAAALKRRTHRRALAIAAIVAGALLMWLSPEAIDGNAIGGEAIGGAILMAAGVCLEILGVWLERRA